MRIPAPAIRRILAMWAVMTIGVVVIAAASIYNATRSLSLPEQIRMLGERVKLLEDGRKDQQLRNQGQDKLNALVWKAYEDWTHANSQRAHR